MLTIIIAQINKTSTRVIEKKYLKMTSPPEPQVQIQNNLTEMFLMMPSTKIDQNVKPSRKKMTTNAKIEIYLKDLSLATGQH